MYNLSKIDKFCNKYNINKLVTEYKSNELAKFGLDIPANSICKIEISKEELLKIISDLGIK